MTESAAATALLVPWATGKCGRCGATLVTDPLPHRCVVIPKVPESDYRFAQFRRRPIVSSKMRPRTGFWREERR